MRYKIFMLFVILVTSCFANDDTRFFNLKELLTAYGYYNGEYVPGMDNWSIEEALYYSYQFPTETDEENVQVINKEMPSNKLGALRLCSFILLRSTMEPQYIKINKDFLSGIIEDLKLENTIEFGKNQTFTREPIKLTWEEITSFYQQALVREIDEKMAEASLKSQIKSKVKPVLTEYFLTPNESKFLELKEVYYSYKNEVQFIDFIKLFSIDLLELLQAQDVPEFK